MLRRDRLLVALVGGPLATLACAVALFCFPDATGEDGFWWGVAAAPLLVLGYGFVRRDPPGPTTALALASLALAVLTVVVALTLFVIWLLYFSGLGGPD